jgi:uncharacterized protein YfaS (alpha-2-macroglobulin family)
MADANVYDIGDEVELTGTFKDAAGALASPSSVVCRVKKPDGTLLNPNPVVTSPSTGVFKAIVDPDAAGEWWYRFEGTGGTKAAGEGVFKVRDRKVG